MQPPRLRFVSFASAALLALASARAELRFTQTSATLSATADADTLSARFPFQNTGPATVFVAGLTTSCPCTTAQTDKKHLAPGESGTVTVVFKIGAAEGPQSQTVTLLTNENDGASYTLTVKADLPKRIQAGLPRVVPVSPSVLFWSKKPFPTKSVNVDLAQFKDAEITARCTSDAFKITRAVSPDKRAAVVEITPLDTTTNARGELLITVQSGSKKISAQPVPLTVRSP